MERKIFYYKREDHNFLSKRGEIGREKIPYQVCQKYFHFLKDGNFLVSLSNQYVEAILEDFYINNIDMYSLLIIVVIFEVEINIYFHIKKMFCRQYICGSEA